MNNPRRTAKLFVMVTALCSLTLSALPSKAGRSAYDVDTRLAEYARAFPDIQFVHLAGEPDIDDALMLQQRLGPGARDLTYEHGLDEVALLIEAQIQRIVLMLANELPSATLFGVKTSSEFHAPYVCVISLDPTSFRNNPLAATQLLLGELDVDSKNLATDVTVNNERFFAFTLDHEVFHCLDAYLNGPTIRRTTTEIDGCYEFYRSEQRAELFAALASRARDDRSDRFLDTLAAYRTLALLDWDYMHYTVPALRSARESPMQEVAGLGLAALARYASELADRSVVARKKFPGFLAAAHHVATERGVVAAWAAPETEELQDIHKDERHVTALNLALNSAQRAIAGSMY